MRAVLLVIALLLAGCEAQADFAFENASVLLPDPEVPLPPGPNVELVAAICTGCHSADMLVYQPRLGREGWEKTIAKMRTVYRATIDPADEPKIVEYLLKRPVETAPSRP